MSAHLYYVMFICRGVTSNEAEEAVASSLFANVMNVNNYLITLSAVRARSIATILEIQELMSGLKGGRSVQLRGTTFESERSRHFTYMDQEHDKTGGGRACNFHSLLYVRAEYLLQIDTSGRERVRYLEILSHKSLECECVRHWGVCTSMRSRGARHR